MKSLIDLYCGSAAIKGGETLLSANRQRRYERRSDAAGRTVLSAKYSDSFNFVDLARVVISADCAAVDSASCSCPRFNDEKGLCCHCAALLLKYEEADEQKLMRAAAAIAPEHAVKKNIVQELLDVDLLSPINPEPASEKDPDEASAEKPALDPEEAPAADGEGTPTDGGASPSPALAADGAHADRGNVRGIRDFSFRFGNNEKDLYPGELHPKLSRESFELIFGKKSLLTRKLYSRYKEWDGTCYGFAAASGMFVDPNDLAVTDFRADAERPFDLRLSDRSEALGLTLHRFIEALFVSQINYDIAMKRYMSHRSQSHTLLGLIFDVERFERTGMNPVILDLLPNAESNSGHTVFPYRHERLDAKRSRLHIYDSNYPDEVRYLDLEQDEEGNYSDWRFNMQKSVEYSSKTGGMLDYLPHELYRAAWDERAANTGAKPKVLFSTPCADLTVQDEDGKDVLKIAAGRIQPLRSDVVPIRVNGAEAAIDRYDCWIDQGAYRVINDDPERELAFELTGDDLGLEVKTESKEADALIDEKDNALRIKLVENKPWYVKFLNTAKDFAIRAGSSILSNIVVKLLVNGLLFMSNIKPEEITEFTIDGEPANVREHVTFENEQPAAVENGIESDAYEETVDDESLYIANKKLDPEP